MKLPSDKLIIVPISCTCWGSFYQHYVAFPFILKDSDTYFAIANQTYQGLTTCQKVMAENYNGDQDPSVGSALMVPVICACPSNNQIANGVTYLLIYMVTWGDSLTSIGEAFGVSLGSILEANNLLEDSTIYPFTPLLVPLKNETCNMKPKGFFCQPDGKRFPAKLVTILGVGIGLGFLCLVLSGYQLYQYLKKRKYKIRKEKLFKQNGGLLLQQQLSSGGSGGKAKIFTAEELQRATDNYSQNRILGQGGYGTVYKGMLLDGSIVAIKRSKAIEKSQIKQFINEVVILSQIIHRNIVKLLGCCLETEFPLLVYEFIPNGTLSHHIHEQDPESSLSWENRLRIASEIAGAVAYMHSAASMPIFHRDIKSSNILLDDKYSAKVSDFGTSRSVPIDKTHLTTAVQGTFGYLDPEYFQSSQFTEKSDVYSFGVVLVELLTGEKPISFARTEERRNLAAHFVSSTKEDQLFQILDLRVAREAEREDIYAIANLAMRCLRLNGRNRPTMKDVAIELEGLRKSQIGLQIHQEEPWLSRHNVLSMRTVSEIRQESIEDSIMLEQKVESASI